MEERTIAVAVVLLCVCCVLCLLYFSMAVCCCFACWHLFLGWFAVGSWVGIAFVCWFAVVSYVGNTFLWWFALAVCLSVGGVSQKASFRTI